MLTAGLKLSLTFVFIFVFVFFFVFVVVVQGCTGQPFFASGRGGAEAENFGVGRGAQGVKSWGRGGVTVKLRAFSGQGRTGQY